MIETYKLLHGKYDRNTSNIIKDYNNNNNNNNIDNNNILGISIVALGAFH